MCGASSPLYTCLPQVALGWAASGKARRRKCLAWSCPRRSIFDDSATSDNTFSRIPLTDDFSIHGREETTNPEGGALQRGDPACMPKIRHFRQHVLSMESETGFPSGRSRPPSEVFANREPTTEASSRRAVIRLQHSSISTNQRSWK